MIKLIPFPKITKRELMTALMEGRRFTIDPCINFVNYPEIHWDENFGNSPIRMGIKPWDWRGFKYLHEITESHWYDNIPEEGVLCWVCDEADNTKVMAVFIHSIDGGFKEKDSCTWIYANPVTSADLYQETV